jgi:hypothetical protein
MPLVGDQLLTIGQLLVGYAGGPWPWAVMLAPSYLSLYLDPNYDHGSSTTKQNRVRLPLPLPASITIGAFYLEMKFTLGTPPKGPDGRTRPHDFCRISGT